jgi:Family of unknown function (DUF6144)
MTHLQKWVGTLIDGLDSSVDEETKINLLENCGRKCISPNFIKKVKSCKAKSKNNDDFLDRLGAIWKHLRLSGDKIFVEYDRCYCPMIKSYKGRLSAAFCNCSRGWIKEAFESAIEKPVTVVLEKSIKRGDKICRFRVSY